MGYRESLVQAGRKDRTIGAMPTTSELRVGSGHSEILIKDPLARGLTTNAPETLWQGFLVLSAAAFSPAMVLVNNTESPGPATAAVITGAIVGLAWAIRALIVRLGARRRPTSYAVAVTVFVAMNGGELVGVTDLGRLVPVGLALVAGVALYRYANSRLIETGVTWGAFVLVLTPLVTWVANQDTSGQVVAAASIETPSFETRPDVVVVVADGYGSNRVLEEFYGFDNTSFVDLMSDLGFEVDDDMSSNYGRTALSVPSLMQLTYPLEEGVVGSSTRNSLYGALSGQNVLATMMRDNGYQTVYVESGWLGTRCSSDVNVCVPGPWPDESLQDIAHRSVLRGLPGLEEGRTFARGSLNTMRWLDETLPSYLKNGDPDYIYVHVLSPHPPLFLDASCRLEGRAELSGFAVGVPGMTKAGLEVRKDAYVDQIECVNRHLVEVGEAISRTGAVGLILADHGPDYLSQMSVDADTWSTDQMRERFGVLFAAHHPGCEYGDLRSLVNVGRRMISCLADIDLPTLPDRYFDLSRSSGEPEVVELVGP